MVFKSSGRPKRHTSVVNYKERHGDTLHDLEKYLEKVQKEQEQRSAPPSWVSFLYLIVCFVFSFINCLLERRWCWRPCF